MSVNQMNKILLILFYLFLSNIVFAKSFTIDQININAEVLPDGSMQITESRTYTFNGEFSWADYQLPMDKFGEITLFSLREGSQKYYESNDELPGSYYIESKNNTFYVRWFYRAKDQTRTFILKYLATDVIKGYNDVAQLYYKFVGESNQQKIGSVNINIRLPRYAVEDSVKIWAHGPLNGLISFNNGNVELLISPLPAKKYFEARIVFPPSWIPDTKNKEQINKLQEILNEEKQWVEDANRVRKRAQNELIIKKENEQKAWPIAIALSLIGLIGVFLLYKKYGLAFNVPYNLKIDSEIPTNIHPTILCCLFNSKQVYGSAISFHGLLKRQRSQYPSHLLKQTLGQNVS